jgi:hypothetical protein
VYLMQKVLNVLLAVRCSLFGYWTVDREYVLYDY